MSDEAELEYEERLVPILREGVGVIKMIFFKRLKDHLGTKHHGKAPAYIGRLSGMVLNEVFGTPNHEDAFVQFARENELVIEEELKALSTTFDDMRIPLTDALRVQFLCDDREGLARESMLGRAKELGVLILDREIPLPKNFLSLVRTLGASHGLIIPPTEFEED